MAEYSNRVANTFERLGYAKGDVVALLMGNCPEYVAFWLGLSKLGVVAALINHNQRAKALVHSLTIAHCRAVVVGTDLVQGKTRVTASETPRSYSSLFRRQSDCLRATEADLSSDPRNSKLIS